jgi:hypothetical protein
VDVRLTSPGRTVIDVRMRPLGERASTFQGMAGSSWDGMLATVPGAMCPPVVPLTTMATMSVVLFDA